MFGLEVRSISRVSLLKDIELTAFTLSRSCERDEKVEASLGLYPYYHKCCTARTTYGALTGSQRFPSGSI